jgi:hypothetical protein
MAGLKGDMLFLALRMGVECPPLPVGHKNEFTIFTRFFLKQPRVNAQTWSLLSTEFLEKADGNTIFPKLPSMLKAHYSQWKQNQIIRRMEHATRQRIKNSMDHLQRSRSVPAYVDPPLRHTGVDGSTPAINFVTPPAASQATPFVPSTLRTAEETQFCFYEGFCSARVGECGGRSAGLCKFVNSNAVQIPADEEEFGARKAAARKRR